MDKATALIETGLTWASFASGVTYLVITCKMIRAYGYREWKELGYGTGQKVHEAFARERALVQRELDRFEVDGDEGVLG